ncbi:MAG: hypothetical protein F6K58_30000 [Symploca sp. SIO2E9]|nr:hypothetical protein [Symploca sp. SIO2E9]
MAQQLAIVAMIDIDAALKNNSLEGNIYLFDNMKLQGSEGQGTSHLITAIHGTYDSDGLQANEQVLNWLVFGVGSVPPNLPRTFPVDQSRKSELRLIRKFNKLKKRIQENDDTVSTPESLRTEVNKILENLGSIQTKLKSKSGLIRSHLHSEVKLIDVKGKPITDPEVITDPDNRSQQISHRPPILNNVTGEAVDKKIIYQAQYGSPDLVADGWYWSATVSTYQPGTYSYTMHIQLYKPVYQQEEGQEEGHVIWEPVYMTHKSSIRITKNPKQNGFTGSVYEGLLPIPYTTA